MMKVVYVQEGPPGIRSKESEIIASVARTQGVQVFGFLKKQAVRRQLPLASDIMIVGDMDVMVSVLKQIGHADLGFDTYPAAMHHALGRRIWPSTIRDVSAVRTTIPEGGIFIKPARQQKRFTGFIVHDTGDLYRIAHISKSLPIWCSEVVSWIAEYRAYCVNGRVAQICHYDGDDRVLPDRDVVDSVVDTFHQAGSCPAGCGIDFGVRQCGQTDLIEVNDGYALGAYEVDAELYFSLLSARWSELWMP